MGTQADINVRAAPGPAARAARHSGLLPLARLLLGTSLKLVFLFVVSSSTPACVLPVSPEFQNPPGAPNAAPEILDPSPINAAEVATTTSQTFSFTITDPNGGDTLYVRWVADFPPYDAANSHVVGDVRTFPALANGQPQMTHTDRMFGCHEVSNLQSRHLITAAVSDRGFRDDVLNDLLAIPTDGKKTTISWWLTIPCQQQMSP